MVTPTTGQATPIVLVAIKGISIDISRRLQSSFFEVEANLGCADGTFFFFFFLQVAYGATGMNFLSGSDGWPVPVMALIVLYNGAVVLFFPDSLVQVFRGTANVLNQVLPALV